MDLASGKGRRRCHRLGQHRPVGKVHACDEAQFGRSGIVEGGHPVPNQGCEHFVRFPANRGPEDAGDEGPAHPLEVIEYRYAQVGEGKAALLADLLRGWWEGLIGGVGCHFEEGLVAEEGNGRRHERTGRVQHVRAVWVGRLGVPHVQAVAMVAVCLVTGKNGQMGRLTVLWVGRVNLPFRWRPATLARLQIEFVVELSGHGIWIWPFA